AFPALFGFVDQKQVFHGWFLCEGPWSPPAVCSFQRRTRKRRIDSRDDFFGGPQIRSSGRSERVEAIVIVLADDSAVAKRQKHAEVRLHGPAHGNAAERYCQRCRPHDLESKPVTVL